jgi:hypothetical protein
MDGMTLLTTARAAGLVVAATGERLVIRGPRRAEPVALQLLENKTLVHDALLAEAGLHTTPADLPADWHLAWDERAAIMEYDGGLPREQAEARALTDILRIIRERGIHPGEN